MAKIYNQLKATQLQARKDKAHNVSSILGCVLSDINLAVKEKQLIVASDELSLTLIKKHLKQCDQSLEKATGLFRDNTVQQKSALEAFLPVQLSESELSKIVSEQFPDSDPKPNVGMIMNFLKAKYTGQYDSALASRVAQQRLLKS